MSTTPLQFESKVRPQRRSLGLSRKWQSPASAARQNSSSCGLGLSPNTSKSSEEYTNKNSPKSTLPVAGNNVTPNRLVSRYSSPRKRNFKATFKSPIKNIDSGCHDQDVEQEIKNLKKQIQEMTDEEKELRKCGFKEEELQVHIDKLHEYNELKDTAQMLIGKIATIEGRTTKEMYKQFGLDLED